jgi:hypothetical protein
MLQFDIEQCVWDRVLIILKFDFIPFYLLSSVYFPIVKDGVRLGRNTARQLRWGGEMALCLVRSIIMIVSTTPEKLNCVLIMLIICMFYFRVSISSCRHGNRACNLSWTTTIHNWIVANKIPSHTQCIVNIVLCLLNDDFFYIAASNKTA